MDRAKVEKYIADHNFAELLRGASADGRTHGVWTSGTKVLIIDYVRPPEDKMDQLKTICVSGLVSNVAFNLYVIEQLVTSAAGSCGQEVARHSQARAAWRLAESPKREKAPDSVGRLLLSARVQQDAGGHVERLEVNLGAQLEEGRMRPALVGGRGFQFSGDFRIITWVALNWKATPVSGYQFMPPVTFC